MSIESKIGREVVDAYQKRSAERVRVYGDPVRTASLRAQMFRIVSENTPADDVPRRMAAHALGDVLVGAMTSGDLVAALGEGIDRIVEISPVVSIDRQLSTLGGVKTATEAGE